MALPLLSSAFFPTTSSVLSQGGSKVQRLVQAAGLIVIFAVLCTDSGAAAPTGLCLTSCEYPYYCREQEEWCTYGECEPTDWEECTGCTQWLETYCYDDYDFCFVPCTEEPCQPPPEYIVSGLCVGYY
jgi:hypothetical protein